MAKRGNVADSSTVRVTLSTQSVQLLERLAAQGVYGRNAAEVAGRFVDSALQKFVDPPKLEIQVRRP